MDRKLATIGQVVLLVLALVVPPGAVYAVPGSGVGNSPPPAPIGAEGDDTFLLRATVSPNVVLLMDNSYSMNHIEWHEAFDPDAAAYGCDEFDNDEWYEASDLDEDDTFCGNTRKIYDPGNPTFYDGRYLNWYYSDEADPFIDAIENDVASTTACQQSGGAGQFDQKYRRTRFEVAKQVLLDLTCVAEPKNVRFALAWFRQAEDADDEDPNGGYLPSDLGRSNPNHASELESEIKNADIAYWTPLGESLFQIYTYFMPRDGNFLPTGRNGAAFPRYQYDKIGRWQTQSNKWFEDAIEFECEKAFVVVVTDGMPTRDDFDSDPDDTAYGFDDYGGLIGDYHDDGEVEVPAGAWFEESYYLDDIAKYMQDKDFRPDLAEDQVIDTYTVGFSTDDKADAFLGRTADVANGIFFHAQTGDELFEALVAALNDIVEKAQSFTAAAVPSARTTDGGDFYQSYFFPSAKRAFWEGHVRAWRITATGDIIDANGSCALDDQDPGECNSGSFLPSAIFYWDAANEVPDPALRKLLVSKPGGVMAPFTTGSVAAEDLGIEPFASPPVPAPNSALYPVFGSTATTAEGLADEVVQYARGCKFGTGVPFDVSSPLPCLERVATLGDIFHSNPVVVRQPAALIPSPSYKAFKDAYASRSRVIYAGSNAGFMEAFHAGDWQTLVDPARYDQGTGRELFGFMPWGARQEIKEIVVDSPSARSYYVDGSPQVADVWLYSSPTQSAPQADGSEWRTALIGGLRQGGQHYFALDVTNPNGIAGPAGNLAYPGYGWEFPREDDPNDLADSNSFLPYMGETWAQPIITKVRVKVGADDNDGAGYDRWVAIVTGGFDRAGNPNDSVNYDLLSKAGRSIYIIDITTGRVLAEKKFDLGALDDQKFMQYAIPSTTAVFDLTGNGYADVVFVGDTGGNVFKWVVSDIGEDRVNDGSGTRTQPNWPFRRFFQAPVANIGGVDYYKSFFFAPGATMIGGTLYLGLGTGERDSAALVGVAGDDSENNRFYVMTDLDPLEGLALPLPTLTEADLTDVTNLEGGAVINNRGFYFKLEDGEKFVTNVEIFASTVIAATFVPRDTGNPCTSRGEGAVYGFDIRSGKGFFSDPSGDPMRKLSIGPGLPADPKTSVGPDGKDNWVYIEKSGTDLESFQGDDLDLTGTGLYWRELQ